MGVQLNRNLLFDNRFKRNKHRKEPHMNSYRLHNLLYTVMQFLSILRGFLGRNNIKKRKTLIKIEETT